MTLPTTQTSSTTALPRRAGRLLLGLSVAIAAFAWALPSFASYGSVWNELGQLGPASVLVLALVGVANLLSPSASQCAALPGLRFRHAVMTDWATSAVTNTIPGGSAVALGMTWSMFRSFRHAGRDIARCLLVTGVWDIFVKCGTPLIAVLWLSTERSIGTDLMEAAVAGALLFSVVIVVGFIVLAGPGASRHIGGLLDRIPRLGSNWPRRLTQLQEDTNELLRTRWRALTWWTVAGHANLYLLLVLCLRLLGVRAEDLSLAAILAAFAFGRLVTALPLTPGGLGVMEVGLTGALAAVGTADPSATVAAVLVFRFATFFVPIPLGVVSWLIWNARPGSNPGQGPGNPSEAGEETGGLLGRPGPDLGLVDQHGRSPGHHHDAVD